MRRAAAVLAAVVAGGLLAGCTSTVDGRALPAGASGASSNPRFEKLLEECAVVTHEQMADSLGADFIEETFFGAICRYRAYRSDAGVDVTLAWFETGSLYRERATAERLGYSVANTQVLAQSGIEIRVPGDPSSCGVATRAVDAGVIQWWVHAAGSGLDPCVAANRLAELAVRASF